ncbi:protein MAINTENANCE OF PSII UNDER HIGH LIGHT 1 [Heracleum sosnowskyi]|uniref:Protein MAINTENANCE OF PSII UNDER HIGH LIGHT 1 n=1 Tax=Heracleum sosnowskyi TaxID=360622 RepID=A0AAD8MIH7_9APIA|nr:protein MAINTENANCE OF PSII UNDER HIGH LIGHT 1 [Heracleum sosnowskyi]
MASALSAANSCCCYSSTSRVLKYQHQKKNQNIVRCFRIRASADEQEDCNVEECAPDKEVGKVSMEWLAGEKTKVKGTFPPTKRERGWTGYVEKDTAGQTNIYSVEPAVYVAESVISSGTAGSSADGAENTAAVAAGFALIAVAAASSVLLQIGKNPPPQIQTADYSGPSLSYYVDKLKPPELVEASATAETEISTSAESEVLTSAEPESSTPKVLDVQVAPADQENTAVEVPIGNQLDAPSLDSVVS